ncbi:7020_t:CDS:1, partial [Acaulospora colombiana]
IDAAEFYKQLFATAIALFSTDAAEFYKQLFTTAIALFSTDVKVIS